MRFEVNNEIMTDIKEFDIIVNNSMTIKDCLDMIIPCIKELGILIKIDDLTISRIIDGDSIIYSARSENLINSRSKIEQLIYNGWYIEIDLKSKNNEVECAIVLDIDDKNGNTAIYELKIYHIGQLSYEFEV